jgi:ribosomal protein S18 acetylase RimI-like enzyme
MVETSAVTWRRMVQSDLVRVERVGDVVHPDYPEDATIIAERLRLYPTGCLVLDGNEGIQGYAVAHPWLFGRPPPLNTQLGQLPIHADTFYIHDLAITPEVRGGGFGTKAVDLLAHHAQLESFTVISLVAVGNSPRFWRRNGFETAEQNAIRMSLATYRGAVFMARVLP